MGKKLLKNGTLTLQQEKFCQYYAGDEEFFGNGTQSYMKAFPYKGKADGYHIARSEASKLLTKPSIVTRINEILEVKLTEEMADKRLAFLALQSEDKNVALGALKHFNELKGRIVKKIQHSGGLLIGHIEADLRNLNNGDIK